MSLLDRLKALDVDDILGFLVKALDTIGVLARGASAGNAADAIQTIRHVYDVIDEVANAEISPEEAAKGLEALLSDMAANDATADSALDAKFDPGQDANDLDDEDDAE